MEVKTLETKPVQHLRAGTYEPMELRLKEFPHEQFPSMYEVTGKVAGQVGETLWIEYTNDYSEAKRFFDEADKL